jgi:hypothetical protein
MHFRQANSGRACVGDHNLPDTRGETALMVAVCNGHLSAVNLLIDAKSPFVSDLHSAIWRRVCS